MRGHGMMGQRIDLDMVYGATGNSAARRASLPISSLSQRSLTNRMRDFIAGKVNIDITLQGEQSIYSTMDELEGVVTITAQHEVRFDLLSIVFEGMSTTFVERLGTVAAVNGRTEARQKFLKLHQPTDPTLKVLEAGRTYKFPFLFAIPNHLLLSSCRHKVANPGIQESHLQVPPSFGDRVGVENDMAPDMAKISYGIAVRLNGHRDKEQPPTIIAEKIKPIRVIPAVEEAPPMHIEGRETEYCLRKEKGIRKGLFKGKIGRMIMEAEQPRSFQLPGFNTASDSPSSPVTTTVTVLLRFDPVDPSMQPPRLGSLSTKLKSFTYYATTPMRETPSEMTVLYDYSRGVVYDSISLSSRNMSSAQWKRQDSGTCQENIILRRDSASSNILSAVCPEPSESYKDGVFYVTELLVPIQLPQAERTFVPTFHTCLISRSYLLELSLSVPPPGGSAAGIPSSLTLKVPVQISAQRTQLPERTEEEIREEEMMAALEAQDSVDEDYFFSPRSIAPLRDEYLNTDRRLSRAGSVGFIHMLDVLGEREDEEDEDEGRATRPVLGRGYLSAHSEPHIQPPPGYSLLASRAGAAVRG